MASFRRTLSPHHHDRAAAVNGGVCSPSPLSKSAAAPPSLLAALRRLLLGLLLPRHSRKIAGAGGAPPPWKPSLYRFFFCFLLGLLLGFTPFFNLSEIKPAGDFAFESRSSSASGSSSIRTPEEIVHAELRTKRDPRENFGGEFGDRKLLIVVTPTYNRAFQAFYLNRLGQTLRLVAPPLLWVVVESEAATDETAEVLRKSGVMYRHVVSKKNLTDIKDRGVHQRNAALELIELHRLDGIVYFADDDNAYSLELFDRMREIKRFGTWPVAMLAQGKAKAILEGPVCNGTQVIGWHTNEKSKRLRRFHIDMSGFAFNSTILWDPKRWNRPTSAPIRQLDSVKEGFQETTFIEQIVEDESQMEGLPHGCLRIMNWHLHIESSNLVYPSGWLLEKTLNAVIPLKS